MAMFQTFVHPTDFDEPSMEAFRVAQSLAQALDAKLVVFHVVPPPAVLTQDGRVILDPDNPEPVDLWAEYRTLQADTPKVPVQYAVVVGDMAESRRLLEKKIRELGEGTLVVMGSHGRRGHQAAPLGQQDRGGRARMPLPRAGCEGSFAGVARGWCGGGVHSAEHVSVAKACRGLHHT
jgi:nucleotide-binding universal stress UspA family protein